MPLFFAITFSFFTGLCVMSFWHSWWIVVFIALLGTVFPWRRWWIFFSLLASLCVGSFLVSFTIERLEMKTNILGEKVAWGSGTLTIEGEARELFRTTDWSHAYRFPLSTVAGVSLDHYEVALIIPPNLTLTPGDHVVAQGKFSFPSDTEKGAFQKQLWYRGMVAEFRVFTFTKTPPPQYGFVTRWRNTLNERLALLFPESGYTLMSGILLGQRFSLDDTLREKLKVSGLMHIMVVSGANVMMLIIMLSLFLRALTPWARILVMGSVLSCFVLLVGADAPVIRAALMGCIGYGASLWGRQAGGLFLPFLVALLIAFFQPLSIAYDIGLQLSFFSVLCIIVFSPAFKKFFSFLGIFFDEAAALTLSATVGTLPLTLFYFGTFSLIGPLANLLVAPALPLLMYSGILALCVSFFSDFLGYIVGYIPWILAGYILRVIDIFGRDIFLLQVSFEEYRTEIFILMFSLLVLFLVRSGKMHLSSLLVGGK